MERCWTAGMASDVLSRGRTLITFGMTIVLVVVCLLWGAPDGFKMEIPHDDTDGPSKCFQMCWLSQTISYTLTGLQTKLITWPAVPRLVLRLEIQRNSSNHEWKSNRRKSHVRGHTDINYSGRKHHTNKQTHALNRKFQVKSGINVRLSACCHVCYCWML